VPSPAVDVLDPTKREQVLADRSSFLAQFAGRTAFDAASSLLSEEVLSQVGIVPREQDPAPQILRQMCVRCHGHDTPPELRRAGFDATALDHFTPAAARAIKARLRMPRHSPSLMPPLRAGELPPWALERVTTFIEQRCADPRPHACE
jgi:hypothetical protein